MGTSLIQEGKWRESQIGGNRVCSLCFTCQPCWLQSNRGVDSCVGWVINVLRNTTVPSLPCRSWAFKGLAVQHPERPNHNNSPALHVAFWELSVGLHVKPVVVLQPQRWGWQPGDRGGPFSPSLSLSSAFAFNGCLEFSVQLSNGDLFSFCEEVPKKRWTWNMH